MEVKGGMCYYTIYNAQLGSVQPHVTQKHMAMFTFSKISTKDTLYKRNLSETLQAYISELVSRDQKCYLLD